MNARSGLALVELAVVLVIVGLLVGGAVVGQEVIRAAQLRAVSDEFGKYQMAVQNFRTKYSALPGDMKNATSFWGDNGTYCASASFTDGTPGTCNGDADGIIDEASAATTTGERYQFWNQLSYSGLIGGYFSGIAGSGAASHHVLGTNAPNSKRSNAGWTVQNLANHAGGVDYYALDYGNHLRIGAPTTAGGPTNPAFTPAEAYSIDQKLDDGKPATGLVVATYWNNLCAAADDGGSALDDLAASYRLTDETARCIINFVRLF